MGYMAFIKNIKLIILLICLLCTLEIVSAQVFIPFGFNGAKVFSQTTAGNVGLQGTAGMTQIISAYVDDASTCVTLPFEYYIDGAAYTTWCIGSNWYITAGTGSANFNSLSGSNPAIPKFHLDARDNSYDNVYTLSGVNFFRIRLEGRMPYNAGAINSYYEFTFYRPMNGRQFAMVVFGALNRTDGQCGVASAAAYFVTCAAITQNSSYVFESNFNGTTWTIAPASNVTGHGTTF